MLQMDTRSQENLEFVSTAGPGAMNLVMGVTTAFKDSVPMLVITGDNIYSNQGKDNFNQ